ncbi:unnamed protein product [marine sediment metagenome]|uniref:Metallo-beta-lactamase domain-containing protein n=1 Tax=marine sediment metagenome TaxID=412755 RepID=X1LBH3_9ZZZZ
MRKVIFWSILIILLVISGVLTFSKRDRELTSQKMVEKETKISQFETSKEEVTLITVYDNYQHDLRLKTGWGFSCLVKINNESILFDTGADSPTLLSNMEKVDVDPTQIDKIVLSHIHGDHVGGLEGFLKRNGNVTVYIPASFPDSMRREIESYRAEYKDIKETEQISENIYSTGELGVWVKEQSLIVNTNKGLVVITGCAHPGIVNIIKKTKEIFPKEEIYLVIGGFHLAGFSDSELKNIINDFKKLGVQIAAPCHCSGDRTRELFKEEYGENFIENGVGKIINI